MKKILQKIFPKKFHRFYKNIRDNNKLDKELIFISDYFIKSESYKTVSNQWHLLNINDYNSILKSGLNNLGRDTFSHYFNFYDYKDEYLKNLLNNLDKNELINLKANFFKKHKNLNLKESVSYNYLLLLLYINLKKSEYFKFLSLLKDETYLNFGDYHLNIENTKITSEKIISLFDLENIEKFSEIEKNRVLEIGAGSGRMAECILTIKNISSYTICDIPPAIYISYKRMKLAFPEKKIKLLIDVEDKEKFNYEIKNNDISFIFPHQIRNIKEKFYNLVIGIDCFHEMDKSTLKFYFNSISNLTDKFYFSIWKKTKNWHSGNLIKKTEKLDYEKGDYPIPHNWTVQYKSELKFPSTQLGIGYLTKN